MDDDRDTIPCPLPTGEVNYPTYNYYHDRLTYEGDDTPTLYPPSDETDM